MPETKFHIDKDKTVIPNTITCDTDKTSKTSKTKKYYDDRLIDQEQYCSINLAKNVLKIYNDNSGWQYDKISKTTENKIKENDYLCTNDYAHRIITNRTMWTKQFFNKAVENITPPSLTYKEELNKDEKITISINEERWYDWFTIPDYHNGNKYSTQIEEDASNNEIVVYNFCQKGYILDNGKCIKRSKYKYGMVKNFLHYSPYALIFLLGLTKKDIIDLQKKEMEKLKKGEIFIEDDLYDEIYTNQNILENIFSDIQFEMEKRITELLNEPFTYVNILPPFNEFVNDNIINYKPEIKYKESIYLETAYGIAKKIATYITSNDVVKLKKFKDDLGDISNLKGSDLDRQFIFLQKACNVCFSYQSKEDKMYDVLEKYSKNIIENLKNIDPNYNYINVPRLSEVQILKQRVQSSSTRDDDDKYKGGLTCKTDNCINIASSGEIALNVLEFNTPEPDPKINFLIKLYNYGKDTKEYTKFKIGLIDVEIFNNSLSSTFIKNINLFILSLLLIIWLYAVIKLLLLFWSSFAYILNYILYGVIFCIYGFFAVFRLVINWKSTNFKGIILNIHRFGLLAQLWSIYSALYYNNNMKKKLNILFLVIGIIILFSIIIKELIKIISILNIKTYPEGYNGSNFA